MKKGKNSLNHKKQRGTEIEGGGHVQTGVAGGAIKHSLVLPTKEGRWKGTIVRAMREF